MPRDFLRLVTRPSDIRKALQKITLGSLISATGLGSAGLTVAEGPPAGTPAETPTIVDRSKKAAKLVLQLPGQLAYAVTEHRSHRSHSSHRSHYSSSGGTTPAPVVRTPPPRAAAPVQELGVLASSTLTGQVESIDKVKRVFVIKQTGPNVIESVRRTFAYRDDTKIETMPGITFRFDEFVESTNGKLPIAIGDKVDIQWRQSTDGKTQIATSVQKTR